MFSSWILVLVTLMAGSSKGKKVKKGKRTILDKDKPILGRFTIGDFGDSEAEDSMDWDALSVSDDEVAVQGPSLVLEEIKEDEHARAPSPIIQYTRKKSNVTRGVRFNDTVIDPIWGQKQSHRPEEKESQTSTIFGESSQDTTLLSSIRADQQRLFSEHANLAKDIAVIATELQAVKEGQLSLSQEVTNIRSLIESRNQVNLDSD